MVVPQDEAQLLNPVIVPPAGVVCMAAVQVNIVEPAGVTVEFNATEVAEPLQIVCGEAEPTGTGLTVTSTVNVAPLQVVPALV